MRADSATQRRVVSRGASAGAAVHSAAASQKPAQDAPAAARVVVVSAAQSVGDVA
jgi:hypothetical protein